MPSVGALSRSAGLRLGMAHRVCRFGAHPNKPTGGCRWQAKVYPTIRGAGPGAVNLSLPMKPDALHPSSVSGLVAQLVRAHA